MRDLSNASETIIRNVEWNIITVLFTRQYGPKPDTKYIKLSTFHTLELNFII